MESGIDRLQPRDDRQALLGRVDVLAATGFGVKIEIRHLHPTVERCPRAKPIVSEVGSKENVIARVAADRVCPTGASHILDSRGTRQRQRQPGLHHLSGDHGQIDGDPRATGDIGIGEVDGVSIGVVRLIEREASGQATDDRHHVVAGASADSPSHIQPAEHCPVGAIAKIDAENDVVAVERIPLAIIDKHVGSPAPLEGDRDVVAVVDQRVAFVTAGDADQLNIVSVVGDKIETGFADRDSLDILCTVDERRENRTLDVNRCLVTTVVEARKCGVD